ncbi:MAG: DUF3560 domain-containing protein [Magnetococcales bacterium]|nr:DUF3560 domain-containing protein [Magnetococcales bacterium]
MSDTRGRRDFEERRNVRIRNLEDAEERKRRESAAAFDRNAQIGERFYGGQPILVGHHSERSARRDQERMHNLMRKSIEADEKADELAAKVEAAKSNTAISADDPDAVQKLEKRLDGLEEKHTHMLAVNAAYRRFLNDPTSLDTAELSDETKQMIRSYRPDWSGGRPFESFELSNNSAEMRRLKERISRMKIIDAADYGERQFGGARVVDSKNLNRIQIFLTEKPDFEFRQKLKSNGWRWSPSESAWQKMRCRAAFEQGCELVERHGGAS